MKRIIYRPAALCAVAFFAFSVFLSYTGAAMCRILLPISLVLLAGALIFCFCRKSGEVNKDRRLALICAVFGIAAACVFSAFVLNDRAPAAFSGESGSVMSGTVEKKLWGSGTYSSYSVRISEADGEKCSLKILVSCADASLAEGDLISVTGVPVPVGESDFTKLERYLRSEGITYCAEAQSITYEGKSENMIYGIARLRRMLSGKILSSADGDGGALINALVTGDRSALSDGISLDFERLGISHLLAISGIHMSVIVTGVSALLSLTPAGKRRRSVLLILFVLLYIGIGGMSASVVRSGTMLIIGCVLQSFGRRRDPFSVLALSVAVIALADRNVFYDTGFLLSVLSVAGVLWFSAAVQNRGGKDRGALRHFLFAVASPAVLTLAVSLFTLPVISLEFGQLSFAAPLANIIFIPLITLLLYLIPVFLITLPFPPASAVIGKALGAYASFILKLCDRLASAKALTFSVRYPLFILLSLIAVCGAVMLLIRERRRLGAFILALSCVSCVLSAGIYELARRDTVTLTAFSGSGGDIMCVTDGSRLTIIDMTSGRGGMMRQAMDFAGSVCITEIDSYILTHYHTRHVNAVKQLLSEVYVDTLWLPEPVGTEEAQLGALIAEAAAGHGTQVRVLEDENTLGNITYSPGKRCWLSRSTEAVYSFTVSAYGKTALFISPGFFDVGEDFRALTDYRNADLTVYGSHGAKPESGYAAPDRAECLVFLGDSAGFFPADDAISLADSGCIIEGSGYTVKWKGHKDNN